MKQRALFCSWRLFCKGLSLNSCFEEPQKEITQKSFQLQQWKPWLLLPCQKLFQPKFWHSETKSTLYWRCSAKFWNFSEHENEHRYRILELRTRSSRLLRLKRRHQILWIVPANGVLSKLIFSISHIKKIQIFGYCSHLKYTIFGFLRSLINVIETVSKWVQLESTNLGLHFCSWPLF